LRLNEFVTEHHLKQFCVIEVYKTVQRVPRIVFADRTTFRGSFHREHDRNLSPIVQTILTHDAFDMGVLSAMFSSYANLLVLQTAPDQQNHVTLA
jgi:hypothetical protein